MSFLLFVRTACLLLSFPLPSSAIALDVENRVSIRKAAALAAHGVQSLYNGNQSGGVLGKFPYPPYYWWESGGAWGGMMTYWHFTGDNSYNKVISDALISQLGPGFNFDMPVEAFDEGNDDQAFWVFAAMEAAEYGFPNPPSPLPSWLHVAMNAFNTYRSRWDTTTCGGGLKWQFHPSNAGYDYKNSVSNGAFFQLSARLARFTGNETYLHWANKIWDWCTVIGLVDNLYNVFDGTDDTINCTRVDHHQWSYNVGSFLYGAAMLQNYTNSSSIWVERTVGLLAATSTFFTPFPNATNIMFEAACERGMTCNVDQLSMKAYLVRWLAATSLMAPFTARTIGQLLRASAIGAAAACTSGPYGNTCGSKWYIDGYDGNTGLGQQLCAMEVLCALLVNDTKPPKTMSNVHIRTAPTTFAAPTETQPPVTPSASARPLFDGPNASSKIMSLHISYVFGGMVSVFFVTMIW